MSVYHKHLVLSHYITAMVHYLQQQDMLPFVSPSSVQLLVWETIKETTLNREAKHSQGAPVWGLGMKLVWNTGY